MALGLLLWVSWICSLLFNGNVGLPAIKGYGYPYVADSRNIGDDKDEVLNHGMGYSKPSVAQQLVWIPSQNLNIPSAREVERLINGESRDWGMDDLDKPLLFPLRPINQLRDPAKPQPSPIQPQSSVASTNRVPISPNTGGSTRYANPSAYGPTPSYTSQAFNFESWQPELTSRYGVANYGFGNQDFNTASSAAGGDSSNLPHLVFEEVFQLPSNTDGLSNPHYGDVSTTVGGYSRANELGFSPGYVSTREDPSFPSYPSNVGAQPAYPSLMASPSSSFSRGQNLDFSRARYQPHNIASWVLRKPVFGTQESEVSQRVSEPIPPPPPSSYIVRSRNGYQRNRHIFTKSRYSPEFPFSMAVSSKGVKRLSSSQPAASKGVKNPKRTKW